MFKDHN